MAFNRNSVNLGNQFSHAAAVSRGEASEENTKSRNYYRIPDGMKMHKWTAKEERFNILLAKNNSSDPDDTGYKFYKPVPVHELPNLQDPKHPHRYPCLKILGKPCPCCERKEQLDDGTKGGENWDRIKPFIPKERVLYYFNPEGTNEILLHECAAKQKGDAAFPQRLMSQATAMSDGSMPIPFASPNADGMIVKVNTAKDTFNGQEFYQASAVNFFQRKELPADELYDRCLPWNDVLNFGSYDEMTRVMNGGEPDPYSAGKTSSPAQQAPQYTEEQKQAEFERACEQSLQQQSFKQASAQPAFQPSFQQTQPHAPQGFQTSPLNSAPPARSFPSEQPAPQSGNCPNGLRFGADFETSRKCCNCNAYEACRNFRRNG